jgi:hypothetical protein
MALGFRTPGDTIRWDQGKYSRHLDVFPSNTAIVIMEDGLHYAFGNRVGVILPELDTKTGKFGKYGEKLKAMIIREAAPDGLPDIVIGEPWSFVGTDKKVKEVLLRYKTGSPNHPFADHQVDMPSPFSSACAHLERVAQEIDP